MTSSPKAPAGKTQQRGLRYVGLTVVLPGVQFASAAAIVLTSRWLPPCWLCLAGAAGGALLALWSWIVMGRRGMSLSPIPRSTNVVTSGPYRYIRHPMYTALLLACLALVLTWPESWRVLLWLVLLITLHLKARTEERLLKESHPAYRVYAAGTARYVPFIY